MKIFKTCIILSMAAVLMSASSCKDEKYPDLGEGLFAEIITSKGTMVARLTYDKTPITVANFVALAEGNHPMVSDEFKGKPFYNGLIFHRVMDQFMIQGGDPKGNGTGNGGYRFGDEFDETLRHDKAGILAMANGGPNSNGSQFYITEVPYPSLDAFDSNDNLKNCSAPRVSCHAVFGELVLGIEIQDTISNVPVDNRNKPIDEVTIQEVNILRQGFEARKFDAVKTWETELPLLEDKQKKMEEEARKKAEEARKASEAKKQAAAIEMLPLLNDYKSKTQTSASGLQFYFLTQGTGPKPKQGQDVMLNYEGYFIDGFLFDSNLKEVEEKYGMVNDIKIQRDMYQPMKFRISPDVASIQGFKEAVANMKVGDKVFVYVPSHLAYGEAGRGQIQPNTDLTFIIEMLEIVQ